MSDINNPNARYCAVCTERNGRATWHLPPVCKVSESAVKFSEGAVPYVERADLVIDILKEADTEGVDQAETDSESGKAEPCGVCKFHWNMIVMPGGAHNVNCPHALDAVWGCPCDGCGNRFKVDVNVSNELWARIQPRNKPTGAGLLCGVCVFSRLEALAQFDAFTLTTQPALSPQADNSTAVPEHGAVGFGRTEFPEPLIWLCSCGEHNDRERQACRRCDLGKPETTIPDLSPASQLELCTICDKPESVNAHSEGEHMGQHDFTVQPSASTVSSDTPADVAEKETATRIVRTWQGNDFVAYHPKFIDAIAFALRVANERGYERGQAEADSDSALRCSVRDEWLERTRERAKETNDAKS